MMKQSPRFSIFITCLLLTIVHEPAFPDSRKVLEMAPMLTGTYSNLGTTALKKGEYQRALFYFNKALEIDPTLATVYNNRGIVFGHLGLFRQALSDYSKALEIDPTLAEIYSNRGLLYLENGEYHRAIKDFDQALSIGSSRAQVYNNRGIAYMKRGEYERALSDFSRALKMNPRSDPVYSNNIEQVNKWRSAPDKTSNLLKRVWARTTDFLIEDFQTILETDQKWSYGGWANAASINLFGGSNSGTKVNLFSGRLGYLNLCISQQHVEVNGYQCYTLLS